jgi:hypothetical protein
MQLDDVREQLHELATRVPAGSVEVGEVYTRTRRSVGRQRIVRGAAVLVVLVGLGTLGVVINASRPAPPRQVTVSGPTTTAVVPRPVPLTAAQLRAHDGVGVPAGWAPVDDGAARLWVPQTWTLESPGECFGPGAALPPMVSIGKRAQAHCGTGPPAQSVALIATAPANLGPLLQVVNGYRIYAAVGEHASGGLRVYEVPQLGVQLIIRSPLSDRILATLGPSARTVALAFAGQRVPRGSRPAGEPGVTLSIPAGWRVGEGAYCGWPYPPALIRVTNEGMSCPPPLASLASSLRDGVLVYAAAGEFGPQPAPPIALLHHGATTVSVYAAAEGTNELELVVRRAGAASAHELSLGLGRNGRVAGGVLASIRATS